MDKEQFKLFMEQQQKSMGELIQQLLKSDVKPTVSSFVPTFREFNRNKENFNDYVAQMEAHFNGNNVVDEEKKKSLFLSWVGTTTFNDLRKLYNDGDQYKTEKFTVMIEKLKTSFRSKMHVLAARCKFLHLKMNPDESYSEWIGRLREASRECEFECKKNDCAESYFDWAIRDMIVMHTHHEAVRTACLQKSNPSLEEVTMIATSYETTQSSIKILTAENSNNIQEVKVLNDRSNRSRSRYRFDHSKKQASRQSSGGRSNSKLLRSCPGCGIQHQRQNCRFLNEQCHGCNKTGHIKSVCKSFRSNQPIRFQSRQRVQKNEKECINSLEVYQLNQSDNTSTAEETTEPSEQEKLVHTVSDPFYRVNRKIFIKLTVNEIPIDFQFDTGATASMVGKTGYLRIKKPKFQPTSQKLTTYGGTPVQLKGVSTVAVKLRDQIRELPLLITNSHEGPNIFGMDWVEAFELRVNLLQSGKVAVQQLELEDTRANAANQKHLQDLVSGMCRSYSNIFENKLGCCTNFRAHLMLKENAVPRFFKSRPVSFSQMGAVKKEIERLVEIGVLKSIQYSQWAAPIVAVTKPDSSVRLCGDFKVTVNPQLMIEQYPIPRAEELFHRLQSGRFFSKIDLAEAYLQIPIDDESKEFVVINTPNGLYQFQRMPFGIASAPAVFQKFMDQLLVGLPNTASYLDDIVVSGESIEEHLKTLELLFKRLDETGLKCNLKKCQFLMTEIKYLGHLISKDGIQPSHEGVAAIEKLPRPKNLKEVESFLGKANYYNKFLRNFSSISTPLNDTRRKNIEFTWNESIESSFQTIKKGIVEATKLVHFRNDLPLVLATDASNYGIGAVISHLFPNGEEKPIAFASKTLNEHQRRYSQIEKEALAIIFGCTRFHQYLYGRHFELLTDHKPLVSLFHPEKKLPVMTVQRLQRWAITLMGYNYTIRYRPTTKHSNADALSRLPIGPDPDFDNIETCLQIEEMYEEKIDDFPIDFETVRRETKTDPELRKVVQLIQHGWPEVLPKAWEMLGPYQVRKYCLNTHRDVILLQNESTRIVIPKKLQTKVLALLHEGHWGIVRTKQLARRHCWWPGIDLAIEKTIKECKNCQEVSSSPPREFSSWPTPQRPWERIHIDFAGPFQNSMWFLCVDALSKYPYVVRMNSITSTNTIKALQAIFASEGLPDVIVSDNGTSFISEEFQIFCSRHGIEHLTSAPFHPSSNGEAERCVRSFKTSIKKLALDGFSTDNALLTFLSTYRFNPGIAGKSPAEILHGRQPKTCLSLMSPPDEHRKQRKLSKFTVNDYVFVRNFGKGGRWESGKIVANIGRMMYEVRTDSGIVRRHQNQIRPRKFALTDHEMSEMLSKTNSKVQVSPIVQDHIELDACSSPNMQSMGRLVRSPQNQQQKHSPGPSTKTKSISPLENRKDQITMTGRHHCFSESDTDGTEVRRSQRIRKPVVRFDL